MLNIHVNDAIAAVRKNLDEQNWNPSMMYGQSEDNAELDSMIALTIPEAIRSIHAEAPSSMMEGKVLDNTSNLDIDVEAKVLDIDFRVTGTGAINDVFRLISFKCSDSRVLLNDVFYENSPMARAQLNPYVRGTKDKPVMVQMGDSAPLAPHYRYYTTEESSSDVNFRLEYFPEPTLHSATGQSDYYEISTRLYDATIYQLTAMVLANYGENDKAGYFQTLANSFINQ